MWPQSSWQVSGCQPHGRDQESAEIADLVRRIDENPDQAHYDYSPAVFKLIEHGRKALPPILPLLNDPDVFRRMRAKAVLSDVIAIEYGFKRGKGFPNSESEKRRNELWLSMGDYTVDAPEEKRLRSIALWQEWLEKKPNQAPEPTPGPVTPRAK